MEFGPVDDFEKSLMEWVCRFMELKSHSCIEIEAKLGVLLKAGAIRQLELENKSIWAIEEKERKSFRKHSELGIQSIAMIDSNKSPASFHSQVPGVKC